MVADNGYFSKDLDRIYSIDAIKKVREVSVPYKCKKVKNVTDMVCYVIQF